MPQNKKLEKKSTTPKKIKGLETRLIAAKILAAIIKQKKSLDGLLDKKSGHPGFLKLPPLDQNLCRAIILASLRHHIAIEKQLQGYLKNPLPAKADALSFLFHISAAQILYLNIPSHAAIFLAVEATKKDPRLRRFTALVNAILRQFAKDGEKFPLKDSPLTLTPEWFIRLLKLQYDSETIKAIICAQNHQPPLDITVKDNPSFWAQKLNALIVSGNSLRLKEKNLNITELPGFSEGAWWVQNTASAIPAQLMPNIQGKNVADLCAAPGGKTAQLILQGANVTAIEKVETRAQRLKENLDRLQLKAKIHIADLLTYSPKENFDAVLLDAPCSSTGTIRRHSDILWNKDLKDIEQLAQLQYQLLVRAIKFTKPGGTIIFSNCSLAPQEGEELIEKILQTYENIRLSPLSGEEFPKFKDFLTKDGYLRTHPASFSHANPLFAGMDGFFAARLIKIS